MVKRSKAEDRRRAPRACSVADLEIAREPMIGEQTVKTYVSNMLTKLNLQDRVQAAIFALRHQQRTDLPPR